MKTLGYLIAMPFILIAYALYVSVIFFGGVILLTVGFSVCCFIALFDTAKEKIRS